MSTSVDWWRSVVVYQVYLRSFADGNGDGVGDIAGLRTRLGHLVDLGVDALWINPWYPSPMKDAGYDVSDHRDVAPAFGTLAEAEALLAEARQLGLRVLLDLVPNHTSDRHPWFRAALPQRRAHRNGTVSSSETDAEKTANNRRMIGSANSAAPPGPGSPTPTTGRGSGICTCTRPSSRT